MIARIDKISITTTIVDHIHQLFDVDVNVIDTPVVVCFDCCSGNVLTTMVIVVAIVDIFIAVVSLVNSLVIVLFDDCSVVVDTLCNDISCSTNNSSMLAMMRMMKN